MVKRNAFIVQKTERKKCLSSLLAIDWSFQYMVRINSKCSFKFSDKWLYGTVILTCVFKWVIDLFLNKDIQINKKGFNQEEAGSHIEGKCFGIHTSEVESCGGVIVGVPGQVITFGGLREGGIFQDRVGGKRLLKEIPTVWVATGADSSFRWKKLFTKRTDLNLYFMNHLYRLSLLQLNQWWHSGLIVTKVCGCS